MADTTNCYLLSPTIIKEFFARATRVSSSALTSLNARELGEMYDSLPEEASWDNKVIFTKPTERDTLMSSFAHYFKEYKKVWEKTSMNANNCLPKDFATPLCGLLTQKELMTQLMEKKICPSSIQKKRKRNAPEKKSSKKIKKTNVENRIKDLENLTDIGEAYVEKWDWGLSDAEINKIKGWKQLYETWGYRMPSDDHSHSRYERGTHVDGWGYALQKYTDPFFRNLQQVDDPPNGWGHRTIRDVLKKYGNSKALDSLDKSKEQKETARKFILKYLEEPNILPIMIKVSQNTDYGVSEGFRSLVVSANVILLIAVNRWADADDLREHFLEVDKNHELEYDENDDENDDENEDFMTKLKRTYPWL